MEHDPSLARQARLRRLGLIGRIANGLGLGDDTPASPPAPEPEQVDAAPSTDALAVALAELIASAQNHVDGAVALIGRSASEAGDYRRTLAAEVETLETSLPPELTAALVQVTRAMIDRATSAETKLRGMSDELDTLRADLDDARTAAERDPLTGLPNRRAMEKALAAAVVAARAADTMLALAFCDIDHFKRINDRHGHALGDRVLRLVGDTLTDGMGERAFVSRHGGEEFMLLFEGLSVEQAAAEVDAVRAGLAQRDLRSRTDDRPIGSVTFSAGVAGLLPEERVEDLCGRADRALYRAKNGGRNRVEIDPGAPPEA